MNMQSFISQAKSQAAKARKNGKSIGLTPDHLFFMLEGMEELSSTVQALLNKVNPVTFAHRNGKLPSSESLDELLNRQTDVIERLKKVESRFK